MLTIALLMAGIAAGQTVPIIYPSAAETALARLPVPDVVLTRAEADALSDAKLTRRLIGHVPHRRIVGVRRQPRYGGVAGRNAEPLSFVMFAEEGRSVGGRLCRGRELRVTFDTPDATVEPSSLGTPPAERRRRVFSVYQATTLAVVARTAGPSACMGAAYVPVPSGRFDEAATRLRSLFAAADDSERAGLPATCSDQQVVPPRRCEPRAAMREIDWTKLVAIDASSLSRELAPWSYRFEAPRGYWVATIRGPIDRRQIDLRLEYAPPF